MKFIQDYKENDSINDIYYCTSSMKAKTKSGKDYLIVTLRDKTGSIEGKAWDLNSNIDDVKQGCYVSVIAKVGSYNSKLDLNISELLIVQQPENIANYLPTSDRNIEDMFKELLGFINSISNTEYRNLLLAVYVKDKIIAEKIKNHSAAVTVHHSFVGGFLEHTLSVTRLCDASCSNYTSVNRDLLITSALLHDIGKLFEISEFPDNSYTDDGYLLGHIYIGARTVHEVGVQIGVDTNSLRKLEHCILAHHGELEYGSPKKPALLEATILAYADNLDAKAEIVIESVKTVKEDEYVYSKYSGTYVTK